MKIIGDQILTETNIAIKKSLKPGWYPFVKCENDLELDEHAMPIIAKDFCPDGYYKINKELPSISVCAIARMDQENPRCWKLFTASLITLQQPFYHRH